MNRLARLLHLEDDASDAELVRHRLRADGIQCDVVWVSDRQAFESALASGGFDLVLSDCELPHYDGASALEYVREHHPEMPLIFVSARNSCGDMVEARAPGPTGHVSKQSLQLLAAAVRRALMARN